jgi:hypothetical protein
VDKIGSNLVVNTNFGDSQYFDDYHMEPKAYMSLEPENKNRNNVSVHVADL